VTHYDIDDFDIDPDEIRELDISDIERIRRFKQHGMGGAVSDAMYRLGIDDTVLDAKFTPLVEGMRLCGRALPVQLQAKAAGVDTEGDTGEDDQIENEIEEMGEENEEHPQKRMMKTVADRPDGTVLCFHCGGDLQPAQFGEMSCNLAYMQGARGMLLDGNIRDTEYVLDLDEFPVYNVGTTPNFYGGWEITDVDARIYLEGHLTHYVEVAPEDFIFADLDGAQVIPGPVVDEVLLRVEDIYEEEKEERESIREGMTVEEVYDEIGVL
jgi:regulator of RNase E activity RraA